MRRIFIISDIVVGVILILFLANASYGVTYTFKSVRNERISYDSEYFDLGTLNDIIAAAILIDISASDAESIHHTVRWETSGELLKEQTLDYEGEHPSGHWYMTVLAHDISAASFSAWENIDYNFHIDDDFQAPSVFIPPGTFKELTTPKSVYNPLTHIITWQPVEVRNYKVRILGSTYQDDILFDSETIRDEETYQFTDPYALGLINAGAIIAVEARQFKSSSEALNMSIYITMTEPFPDFDYDGDVDGDDLFAYSAGDTDISLEDFAEVFGKSASLN